MPRADYRGRSGVWFECPGCECLHRINVIEQPDLPCWEWNGSLDRPTISPSILVNGRAEAFNPAVPRCHSFVEDGRIRFLTDCTHGLAGQTVDLPEWEA